MNTKIIKLDINRRLYDKIVAKQDDTKSRFLLFQLLDGAVPFNLTDRSVRVYGVKPDGSVVFNDLTVTHSTTGFCLLELTNQMLAIAGTVKLELMITEGDKKLTSIPFEMEVIKKINSNAAVESSNEFGALLTALKEIDQWNREFADKSDKLEELYTPRLNELSSQLETIETKKATKQELEVERNRITEIANKGTTVDVIEGVTKAEIERQIADGTMANLTIQDKSIQLGKTQFSKIVGNIVDRKKCKDGVFINRADGTEVSNPSYTSSDYIIIDSNSVYSYRDIYPNHFAFYDSAKNFIASVDTSLNNPFTTPINARYIRVTCLSTKKTTITVIKGSDIPQAPVNERYEYIDENNIPPIPLEKIPKITPEKFDKLTLNELDFSKSINLFNPLDINFISNKIITNTGVISDNTAYSTTGYIEVEEGQKYSNTNARFSCFFDKDKNVVAGGINSDTKVFTIPVGVKYIRVSLYNKNLDVFMFNEGEVLLPYQPYELKIPNTIIDNSGSKKDLEIYLPEEICVPIGTTIELYNNQVSWCGDYSKYHFKWDCNIGNAMKRKFTIEGKTIGETPISLTVYDSEMNVVATKSSTIKVIPNVISSIKNIVPIGDSLTNNKAWLGEVNRLSNNKIIWNGVKGTTYKHEGRSGFTAGDYLKATVDEWENTGVHPFWDGTRFNWNYYKTQHGMNPDAVQIFLGTNGIKIDPTENANNIKQIVDYIRQDDSNIPIFVVNTLYRGNQNGLGVQTGTDGYSANKGAWKLEEDRKVFNLMVRLSEILKGYTNVHFIPIATCHDSEYNFGHIERNVNPRSSIKEFVPIEATHPQTEGYLQFADIMFGVYCKYLNS